MVRIAQCGAQELYEDGPRLCFVDRGSNALPVALFVVGLLAFILTANGVLQLAMGNVVLGAVFLGIGLVAGALLPVLVRARRRAAARPVGDLVVLVLDRRAGVVLDRAGQPLAPLPGVIFRSAFQIGSSSRALEICFGGRAVVIARGSPFGGSIEDFTHALRQRGFHVS